MRGINRFPAKAGISGGGSLPKEVPAFAGKQVAFVAGAVLLAGCASALPGAHPTTNPTIVSLNPCTDAILAEVADPAQLLAISRYSHDARASSMDLAAARRFRATGGTAEEVAALAPDLVVGSSFMDPATRAALSGLGLRVETFASPTTVEESVAQVRALAAVAGHRDRGEALVRRIEASVVAPAGPAVEAALWQPGGIVPGRGTLVSDLLQRAGFVSYSQALGMAQGDYLPLEQVAADPPELLLVAGEERGQRHPLLARVPGLTVARFEPRLFYCGGPSIPKAMERLRAVRAAASRHAISTSSMAARHERITRLSVRAEEGSSSARSAHVESPSRGIP